MRPPSKTIVPPAMSAPETVWIVPPTQGDRALLRRARHRHRRLARAAMTSAGDGSQRQTRDGEASTGGSSASPLHAVRDSIVPRVPAGLLPSPSLLRSRSPLGPAQRLLHQRGAASLRLRPARSRVLFAVEVPAAVDPGLLARGSGWRAGCRSTPPSPRPFPAPSEPTRSSTSQLLRRVQGHELERLLLGDRRRTSPPSPPRC